MMRIAVKFVVSNVEVRLTRRRTWITLNSPTWFEARIDQQSPTFSIMAITSALIYTSKFPIYLLAKGIIFTLMNSKYSA